MNWFKNRVAAAGVGDYRKVTALLGLLALLTFGVSFEALHLTVLSLAVSTGALAIALEWLGNRASMRSAEITELWPAVLESLESAAASGMSLTEAIRELAESHNFALAKEFSKTLQLLESGVAFDGAIKALGDSLGLPATDLTVEILRQVQSSGGEGLIPALRAQAANAREHELVVGEVQAKQGWVIGTAKLAVAAPWLVVALVAIRPENAALYQTPMGTTIMLFGLIASAFAFRLVSILGTVRLERRVLS